MFPSMQANVRRPSGNDGRDGHAPFVERGDPGGGIAQRGEPPGSCPQFARQLVGTPGLVGDGIVRVAASSRDSRLTCESERRFFRPPSGASRPCPRIRAKGDLSARGRTRLLYQDRPD